MTSHILVCPPDENLINRLRGRRLALLSNGLEEMSRAIENVDRFRVDLHCVVVHCEAPVALIPFQEEWEGIPLAVYSPSLGLFRDFINQLRLLRKLNIRIFLPSDDDENYTSIRILSSLGIESVIVIKQRGTNWDRMCDLMTYSLLGRVSHAPIDPFSHIASHYDQNQRTDHGAVYFDDPLEYLHVDKNGRVALSREDLSAGRFVLGDIGQLDVLDQCAEYRSRLENWRECFLKADGCAYCEGWRICLGRYSQTVGKSNGCQKFFAELMDVAEQYHALENRKKKIWQP